MKILNSVERLNLFALKINKIVCVLFKLQALQQVNIMFISLYQLIKFNTTISISLYELFRLLSHALLF